MTASATAAAAQATLASWLSASAPSSTQGTSLAAEHQPPSSQTQLAPSNGQTVTPTTTGSTNAACSPLAPEPTATGSLALSNQPATGAAVSTNTPATSPTATESQGASTAVSDSSRTVHAGYTQVALDASNNLVITVASGSDISHTLTLQSDTVRGQFVISDAAQPISTGIAGAVGDGGLSVTVPFQAVSGKRLIVNASDGRTALVLDVSAGAFLQQVEYHGGASGSDVLCLTGGTVGSASYSFQSQSDGQLDLGSGGTHSTIQFSGVSAFVDDLRAGVREFHFSAEPETITLADVSYQGDQHSLISSSLGTAVVFADPTSALTIDAAASSNSSGDTFHVIGLDAAFDADLAILGSATDTVNLAGQIDLGAGNLLVTGGRLDVSQTITTHDASINLHGSESVTVTLAGAIIDPRGSIVIDAPNLVHDGLLSATDGGQVLLDAGSGGTLLVSGTIDVAGNASGQVGGTVYLLGDRVGLLDHASIDASGISGGGTVLVGGDYQGKNANIRNASRTYIGPDVRIVADAGDDGDGGRVIVWANEMTGFAGSIAARGAGTEGQGGFVEVSGAAGLAYAGRVDLAARSGLSGILLLDPTTIDIVTTGSNDAQLTDNHQILSADTPAAMTISASTIVSQLGLANVLMQATASINVKVAVDATAAPGNHSLTLTAPTINFNNGANVTTNEADLVLNGDVVLNQNGATVSLSTGASSGGNLTISGNVDGKAGGGNEKLTLISGTGVIHVSGAVGSTTPLGTLTLQANSAGATGAVNLQGSVTAASLTTFGQAYAVSLTGGASIANAVTFSNTGALTLGDATADSTTFTGGVTATAPSGVSASGTIATADQNITLGAVTIGLGQTLTLATSS